jgi:anti-sigma factor ChrR (cupin superfamily)
MFSLLSIEWRETKHKGIYLHVLRRDKETGDATLFIRMEQGCGYPAHSHTGTEEVLILQGGYRDHTGEHRAGDYLINEAGSAHYPIALDGSEDCIMLAITHGGIELLHK